MAEARWVEPDVNFIKETIRAGGESLKRCYQCATCSVICNLSPEEQPFPRKEMIWAQWGLKDRIIRDPDIWLCYQCNDCSTYCPRGAKPAEVLGALRNLAIRHYSTPPLFSSLANKPIYAVAAFALPAVLLFLVLLVTGHWKIPAGPIVYAKFVPHWVIDPLYLLAAAFAVYVSYNGISRFWHDLSSQQGREGGKGKKFSIFILVDAISDVLIHRRFGDCETNKSRLYAHLPVFYGFAALFVTTVLVGIRTYVFGQDSPVPISHFIKWIGNLGALALLVGIILAIYNRFGTEEEGPKGTYIDWVFLWVVFVVAASGILAELFRLAGAAASAYGVYFIHLVLVLYLFVFMPFSKLAHLIYRTTALVYARHVGREVKHLPPSRPYKPKAAVDGGTQQA